MSYTLHYVSTRAEIWQWYWRSWKRGLWRIHVAISVGAGFALSGSTLGSMKSGSWLISTLAVFSCVVAAFAAFPQLMFKSQERILDVGPEGWASKIGEMSGSRKWSEVASVEAAGGAVVIKGKNGNALVIPSRAFESSLHKEQFVRDARVWHGDNG